ncbi:DUF3088 family protein [Colwellia sp. RE-S-Sl-9]
MKPILFLLKMPFEDGPEKKMWICPPCALVEGALLSNKHWEDVVDIRRVDFPRPRKEVIDMLGEENQGLPALIVDNENFLTDAKEIINYLANEFGGAAALP